MSLKLSLQNLSGWIEDSAAAAKGAAELTLESGVLQDGLNDLGEAGGLVGAIFKLGSRAIPDPTPEQRIASRLLRTFIAALDKELKENAIEAKVWKKYLRKTLPDVTAQKLTGEFTWLSIFGSRGRKPGRSWPIIGELADLGRTWVADMAKLEERSGVQQLADDARGRIHETLAREIDSLQTDPAIQQAMTEALSRVGREVLDLLAQELTTLKKYRLFGEVPQDALYIPPRIKVVDLRGSREELDWKRIEASSNGDEILFQSIRNNHPRLVVLEGEMGAGKSCLMRALASRLAEQFRSDRRHAPVYIRWRDVYNEPDLGRAIADQLESEYGLPFKHLPENEDLVYLVDGFDEMNSHQEGYVTECFNRLVKLGRGNCSVVVAMRSTVITPGLRLAWKNREALAVQVQEFENAAIDAWAERWSIQTGFKVTGQRLLALCAEPDRGVAHNPLLLYMLAKYVDPVAQRKERLTRTEVFRIFVDETIRGKLRTSREEFPFEFPERDYRLLLQEIAWLSSWPKHAPKCPARLIRERIPESFLKELNFRDIRTAFVLHFFEPGDLAGNEFEFQPEGFRQYLLAEWCVRTQFEALLDERRPLHPLFRKRDQAIDALAQLPLKEEERYLLNDLYEELGRLACESPATTTVRLAALGVSANERQSGPDLIQQLYERVRDEAEEPPERAWGDEKAGIPQGEKVPPGLNPLRLLVNYWDQCMMATVALFRGLAKDPQEVTLPLNVGRFLRTLSLVRGFDWDSPLKLDRLSFNSLDDLRSIPLRSADLRGSHLKNVALCATCLVGANLTEAVLDEANLDNSFLMNTRLDRAQLIGALMRGADLTVAQLAGANLIDVDLFRANLSGANLSRANLSRANLSGANLSDANLSDANLSGANLSGAHLSGAHLSNANLSDANLSGATAVRDQLRSTHGLPSRLPDGSVPPEDWRQQPIGPHLFRLPPKRSR